MTGENLMRKVEISLAGYETAVREALIDLEKMQFSARLWRKDPGIWKTDAEDRKIISNALGWLDVSEKMRENLQALSQFSDELRNAGFSHVVHMGMGGSSLAPLAFEQIFQNAKGGLPVSVLDSTDPAAILEVERAIPLKDCFFIEASKSGTTVESRSFGEYFYGLLKDFKGQKAGENFAVITDPGSMLAGLAEKRDYRRTFLNYSDIGGRYSALSYFGLVPAALMGIDVSELLVRTKQMMDACGPDVAIQENPGALIGGIMGELARRGRNKVTFLIPQSISTLGMWLEQLIAESTGKEGKGILPVAGEPVGTASLYGEDRLFVYYRLEGERNEALERAVGALKDAGHPLITIKMDDRLDLGQEFLRWEIATACAGAILGINPFDQPNVQESKSYTNQLLKQMGEEGKIAEEKPTVVEPPLHVFAQESAGSVSEALSRFFSGLPKGGFVALLAYITENTATDQALRSIRVHIRDSLHAATTVGYGPRYLHSTGQFHKGGPNTGLFLQLTADDIEDAEVPGQPYTFGALRRAQALGDLQALSKHGRRVIRVHLGANAAEGLAALEQALATI